MIKLVSIIGSGAWGTTIATLLSKNVDKIKLWSYEKAVKEDINKLRINSKYLPGINIANNIEASNDIKEVIENSDLIIFATPSGVAPSVIKELKLNYDKKTPILNITKGFIESENETVATYLSKELSLSDDYLAVLSGPNLAREVVLSQPSSTVIASKSLSLQQKLLKIFNSETFRVYLSNDIKGVELGGTLKNIYALGAGISDGLRFGNNTKSAFLTRCLVEMARYGELFNAKQETFFGLSGMGDLIATSMSPYSRNRRVGELIGSGMSMKEAQNSITGIAEGLHTVKIAKKIIDKNNVKCPIIEEIFAILYMGENPKKSVTSLMGRLPKEEFEI
jgi:glycerol-3-phosphate dehydrogenase (NAD(P)+)